MTLNRCKAGTDSTFWMEEELAALPLPHSRPEIILRALFFICEVPVYAKEVVLC